MFSSSLDFNNKILGKMNVLKQSFEEESIGIKY